MAVQPQIDFDTRKKNLVTFLLQTASSARALGQELDDAAAKVMESEETPEVPFAEGIRQLQNFLQNVDLSHAIRLTARCAAAEQRRNDGTTTG